MFSACSEVNTCINGSSVDRHTDPATTPPVSDGGVEVERPLTRHTWFVVLLAVVVSVGFFLISTCLVILVCKCRARYVLTCCVSL